MMNSLLKNQTQKPKEELCRTPLKLKGRLELDFSIKYSSFKSIVLILGMVIILEYSFLKDPNFKVFFQDILKVWISKFLSNHVFLHKTSWINELWLNLCKYYDSNSKTPWTHVYHEILILVVLWVLLSLVYCIEFICTLLLLS